MYKWYYKPSSISFPMKDAGEARLINDASRLSMGRQLFTRKRLLTIFSKGLARVSDPSNIFFL